MLHSTTPRSDLRILILEDHILFAESLDLALTIEGYEVLRLAVPTQDQTPHAVVTAVSRHKPRIVLLDLDLGGFGEGERLIGPLAKAGINVIVVTGSVDRARWGEAVRLGARKVLSKTRPLNDVLAAVRRINQGLSVMSNEERQDLVHIWHKERSHLVEAHARIERLTVRERQVLAQLMLGQTVREIAAADVVSEATVRTQVKSILAKLEVTSQLAAVGLAHRLGWKSQQRV
jgi:two-component system, NarL family, nitrate/nitrite response regulator NarL